MSQLYIVYGTNEIRIEETVKSLQKDFLKEPDDFNSITLDYRDTPIELIIEEAQTLPFLSDKKAVVVTNAVLFTAERVQLSVEQNIDLMVNYLSHKEDDTLLIFTVNSEKLDNRKKVTKLLKENGKMIQIGEMNESELLQYIKNTSNMNNIQIDNKAMYFLIERTGIHYDIVKSELDKLMLYVQEKITVADVKKVVSKSLEANVFSLTDYLLKNERQKAVEVFRELILQKEEPVKLLGLIASQFRLYYQTKILNDEGFREQDIAKQLNVHPYRVKLALRHIGKYSLSALLEKMVLIRDMDYELKSTYLDSDVLFEIFLTKI